MQETLPKEPDASTNIAEHNVLLHANDIDDLGKQLDSALSERGIAADAIVFCRIFLSDISSQYDQLLSSDLYAELSAVCCSVVGQPPLGSGTVALQAYCLKGDAVKKEVIARLETDGYSALKVNTGNHEFLWTGGMASPHSSGSFEQTDKIFRDYSQLLETHGYALNPDTLRTWIFVDDVDNNYEGMTEARRFFFEAHGLTCNTHYIASTGIEAQLNGVETVVAMDAVAVKNVNPGLVVFMQAPDNMGPTYVYGVTFERGSQVTYGDRMHTYVSGTASIDPGGQVLHVGDVSNQTHRTLDNIQALLHPYDTEINDAGYLLVYLRNAEDYELVKSVVEERVPGHIPRLYLKGPVCRPTWLVEIEGFFTKPGSTAHRPF